MLRHSYIFKHLTMKRLSNYITVKIEKRLRRSFLRGRPCYLIMDPGNICNFRCPFCRTGSRRNRREKGTMSFENFQRSLDPLSEHALLVMLYNWGEPFLNKDVYQMIGYARSKGLAVRLSSNLYAMTREDLEKIVDSGLDHIIVSLDGASEETYIKYRIGGHFQQVFDNVRTLVEIKKQRRSPSPVVEWQFLVMRHNEHEIPKARWLAKKIGVDVLTLGAMGFAEAPYDGTYDQRLLDEWLPRHNPEYRPRYDGESLFDARCFFLWESVTINWDGGLAPCCVLDDPRQDFGNILEQSFNTIWNNELYQSSRREFDARIHGESRCHTICSHCKVFRKR